MELKEINNTIFESIKHVDEDGREYWLARELQKVLEYKQWRRFESIIKKAIVACKNSTKPIDDHFANVGKMVEIDNVIHDHFARVGEMIEIGSKTKRKIDNYKLSRYACYLIVQEADSRKEVVALGKTYFAVQTRRMEVLDSNYELLTEDEKRFFRRKQIKESNKLLNRVASDKGVKNFDKFTNAGYRGLYNGETADDIFKRKGLRYREDILDNMGSIELGANIFRVTQTEDLLRKQNEKSEKLATNTHYKVGEKVRQTIKELGGTMPEDLPTPNKSLKEIDKHNNLIEQNK